MKHVLSLLVALTLATVAAGCREASNSSSEPDGSPLSAAELGWIRAYSAWTIALYDDDRRPVAGAAAVDTCRDRVEELGPPPTDRLEPGADLVATVCPLLALRGARRRALDVVDQADDLIRPYLFYEQALALRTGVTEESRADISLSEQASKSVGYPVEVRCWNDDDWRRTVAEDDAWNDETTDPEDLVGWSQQAHDRIHMVLEQCNEIARVQAGDVDTWSRDDRIDGVDALETLAHEIQHFLDSDADEATVECRAMRSLPRFAQRFGVSSELANELAQLERTEVYPTLDEDYRKEGGCSS